MREWFANAHAYRLTKMKSRKVNKSTSHMAPDIPHFHFNNLINRPHVHGVRHASRERKREPKYSVAIQPMWQHSILYSINCFYFLSLKISEFASVFFFLLNQFSGCHQFKKKNRRPNSLTNENADDSILRFQRDTFFSRWIAIFNIPKLCSEMCRREIRKKKSNMMTETFVQIGQIVEWIFSTLLSKC